MKIAVDIDDTLNIVDRVGRAGAYIERKGLPFKLKDEFSNHFTEVYDWQLEDVLAFVREGGITAFTDAEARPGAREALTRWKQAGHEIVIVTSRPKEWFGNPVNLSKDWLEKRRIPFDGIVAEMEEKGKYCAEHGISVLVDDTVEHCLSAQEYGVHAVLALGRHNVDRAGEVVFSGGNWKRIEEKVNFILRTLSLESRAARTCPARKREVSDGWEMRSDLWRAKRGNHFRVVAPAIGRREDKIEALETLCAEEHRPCRYRLTPVDRILDDILKARGYALEGRSLCMTAPVSATGPLKSVRLIADMGEWVKLYRAVTGDMGTLRSYALAGEKSLFAAAYEGGAPVAVGMCVTDGAYVALYDIRVHADHLRHGYGEAVCRQLLCEAKRLGCEQAFLQVEAGNLAAVSLYRKLGFEQAYDYWYRIKA